MLATEHPRRASSLLVEDDDSCCSSKSHSSTHRSSVATKSGNSHEMTDDEQPPQKGKEPDANAIKMFVGQVPKSYDEKQLLEMFAVYGPVFQLNILKDKGTGHSRGCCFVTFYHRKDAILAQCALHDLKILPGMHHPIQMKPADGENKNDKKLFVGMLNKKMNEQDVIRFFSPFGVIDDCSVLKDGSGHSKGCAFVTFACRQSALTAMNAMHHSQTLQGCSMPLVVKPADTHKDKEMKRQRSNAGFSSSNTTMLMSGQTNLPQSTPYMSLLQPTLNLQQVAMLGNFSALNNPGNTVLNQLISNRLNADAGLSNYQNLASLFTGTLSNLQTLFGIKTTSAAVGPISTSFSPTNYNISPLLNQLVLASSLNLNSGSLNNTSEGAGRQTEGPDGANLFIYHLPQEFTDSDLEQMFQTFGTILSAKVFIDKQTNLSKCFGFVSYDNSNSAQLAIQNMNGFQISSKRLKVQLKRSKNDRKPY